MPLTSLRFQTYKPQVETHVSCEHNGAVPLTGRCVHSRVPSLYTLVTADTAVSLKVSLTLEVL